jgi:hypothetical protein
MGRPLKKKQIVMHSGFVVLFFSHYRMLIFTALMCCGSSFDPDPA